MKRLRIYLAAQYGAKDELLAVAAKIEAIGHTVMSSWLQEPPKWTGPESVTEEQLRDIRDNALEDIRASDMIIAITPTALETPIEKNSGGRHHEFGYAMAKGLDMMVVGDKENLFHHFHAYCCDIETMLDALRHPEAF